MYIKESRSKQIPKLLNNRAINIMKSRPVDAARALLYSFEKSGWKIDKKQAQSFVREFSDESSSLNARNRWFANEIDVTFEDAEYKKVTFNLVFKLLFEDGYLKIQSAGVNFNIVDLGKIDLDKPLKDVFGKIVETSNKIADKIIEAIESGKSQFDVDIKDLAKKESPIKRKIENLSKFFEKKGYKIFYKRGNKEFIYFTSSEFKFIDKQGIYFLHQFKYCLSKINFLVDKINSYGYYLTSFGTAVDNELWFNVKVLDPGKTSPDNIKKSKEEYLTNKEAQDFVVERVKSYLENKIESEDVHKRYSSVIKEIFSEKK